MCGWFYEIKTNFLSGVYGEKMWVVLRDRKLHCYSNPFSNELKQVFFFALVYRLLFIFTA
jgi:hypothetical protein